MSALPTVLTKPKLLTYRAAFFAEHIMLNLEIGRAEMLEFTAEVQAGTARNLEFLRAIENALVWLNRLAIRLKNDADFAEAANDTVDRMNGVIDPDDTLKNALEVAQTYLHDLYELLIKKREYGRNDHLLTDDDGIEDAYTEAIAQAADLHNAINALRWNVGEHDIDASPKVLGKVYAAGDIDQMFDDLLSE
jgi:hypothetical protein